MKKATIKITGLLVFMILINFSCNENKEVEKKWTATEKIQNDKLEADLLVEAAQHNLNTIALCDAVVKVEESQKIKDVAVNIKKQQQIILNKIQNLAEENLVSVASKATYQPTVLKYYKNEKIATTDILGTIKNKLETQIEVLDTLRRNTDDDQIQFIAQEYIVVLKVNKELTQHTLESLE